MQQETSPSAQKKEAMKALRQERQQWIANTSSLVKQQKKALTAIQAQMAAGAGTVPEIAKAISMPTADVMWYLAALKKYGEIVEAKKEGSYFRYTLTSRAKS